MKAIEQAIKVKDVIRAIFEIDPTIKSSTIADALSKNGVVEVSDYSVRGIKSQINR